MSNLKFVHSGGNSVSLTVPDTLAANRTLKLPNTTGVNRQVLSVDGSGNLKFIYPAGYGHFLAYLGSSQTVTNNTEETIEFNQVEGGFGQGNAANWFNSSNYKFTPTVTGYYVMHVNCFWDATSDNRAIKHRARIRKNGSAYIADNYAGVDDVYGAFSHNATCISYFNGSSDYAEFRASAHHDNGSNAVLQGNNTQYTYGYGYLLEAA